MFDDFDEQPQSQPLLLSESNVHPGFDDEQDESVAMGAFDDVLTDPIVAKVAPASLVKRAMLTPEERSKPPRVQTVAVGHSIPIQSPSIPPLERVYVPAMGPRPSQMNGGMGLNPVDEGNIAGAAILAVGLGGAAGALAWGLRGGAAGSLAGGALVNAYRASKASSAGDSKEAITSLTYAVIGAGVATWLVLSSKKKKESAE